MNVLTRPLNSLNFRTLESRGGAVPGRARSQIELDKALAVIEERDGVTNIVNYAVVRP